MHLRNPLTALQEMRRVLRIGGLILCTEPINLINRLSFSTVTNVADVETLVNAFRLKVEQVTDDQFAQSRPSVTLVVGARR